VFRAFRGRAKAPDKSFLFTFPSFHERNAGLPPERRIEFRVGIHLGDVVEEAGGDLMDDGVNRAATFVGSEKPPGRPLTALESLRLGVAQ
jgi:hypothetical protein